MGQFHMGQQKVLASIVAVPMRKSCTPVTVQSSTSKSVYSSNSLFIAPSNPVLLAVKRCANPPSEKKKKANPQDGGIEHCRREFLTDTKTRQKRLSNMRSGSTRNRDDSDCEQLPLLLQACCAPPTPL
ncbi:unnamed protein product [Sphagnum balticum]